MSIEVFNVLDHALTVVFVLLVVTEIVLLWRGTYVQSLTLLPAVVNNCVVALILAIGLILGKSDFWMVMWTIMLVVQMLYTVLLAVGVLRLK